VVIEGWTISRAVFWLPQTTVPPARGAVKFAYDLT
jgi:hypothetical protein